MAAKITTMNLFQKLEIIQEEMKSIIKGQETLALSLQLKK